MRIIFLLTDKLETSAFEIGLSWLHRMAIKEPDSAFFLLTDKTLLPSLPDNIVVQTLPSIQPWFPFITALKIKRIIRECNPDGMVMTSQEHLLRDSIPQLILYTEPVHQGRQTAQRKQLQRDSSRARFLVFPSRETAAAWQQWGELPATQFQVIAPVPSSYFMEKTAAEKEQFRSEYTNGCFYFMLTGPPKSEAAFTDLLKSFSVFKKRLQSNMKLVVPFNLLKQFPRYEDRLDTYKYRDELIITGEIDIQQRAAFATAAYALIMTDSCGVAEATILESMQAATPLLLPESMAAKAMAGSSALYTTAASVLDLAEKMMLIYKDETLRTQLIAAAQLRRSSIDPENQLTAFSQLLGSLAS